MSMPLIEFNDGLALIVILDCTRMKNYQTIAKQCTTN